MDFDITKDYFDCPHCGIKKVTYATMASVTENYDIYDNGKFISSNEVENFLIRCNRKDCERITYFLILTHLSVPGTKNEPNEVLMQYPSQDYEIPEYIPKTIRKFFREAIKAYSFGLPNSASAMCRRTIYEICNKQKTQGRDYKQKIINLGLDKRITDPLLNIKSIGDDTLHSEGWDKETIKMAIDTLGIIINMIYIQEERIKDFSKDYSKAKQLKGKK